MNDKTEAQPEALRLAALLDINHHEPHVEQAAAAELRRQHAEIERLRALAATCYAGLGGECDLPVIWLDALNDAANGDPFDLDGLLPYTSPMRAQLVTQTNRAAAAEQQVTALTQRLEMANRLNTDARNQLADMGNPITQCNQQFAQCQSPAGGQWKCGNEYLPYYPDASHVEPAYRDGWNDCYRAAQLSARQAAPTGLTEAVFQVLEGWNIPAPVRKILETAYYAPPPPEREPLSDDQWQALADALDGIINRELKDKISTILQLPTE